jgi:hypothetical protein
MSIKIGSNTVINDSRELENINDSTGLYGNFQPLVTTASVSESYNISMIVPVYNLTMISSIAFTVNNIVAGQANTILLDRSSSSLTPTFPSSVEWSNNTLPNWTQFRYWLITFVCYSNTKIMANAAGYDFV